jgi:hypothetical protein
MRELTIAVYAVSLLALVVLEVLARLPGSRVPTAGECLSSVMRHPAGRILVILSWWWTGWHFLAR